MIKQKFGRLAGSLLLFLIVFPSNLVFAQGIDGLIKTDQFVHKKWDNTNGLPQNTIYDITQDQSGYIWGATEEGLVRFDGKEFKLFNKINTPVLYSNYITSLSTASGGGIWAASHNSLLLIQNNTVQSYDLRKQVKNSNITAIVELEQKKLWVGTNAGQLFVVTKDTVKAIDAWNQESHAPVQQLKQSSEGIWVGTSSGLFKYKKEKFALVPEFKQTNIRAIRVDTNGTIWVGTEHRGLLRFEGGQIDQFSTSHGLPESFVTTLELGSNGSIWVGTSSSGLYRFEEGSFKKAKIQAPLRDDVKSLFVTVDNVIWIGTSGSGLVMARPADISRFDEASELSKSIILPIYEHTNGEVWLGTAGKGVFRIKNNNIINYDRADNLSNEIVLSLYGTGENIYVGSAGGLDRFNLKNDRFDKHYSTSDGLSSNIVQTVFEDSQGKLWILTRAGGVHTLEKGMIKKISLPQSLSDASFLGILEDAGGRIWIGSFGSGMLTISREGKIRHFTEADGLPSNIVLSFYEDREQGIWIATGEGVAYVGDGRFKVLDMNRGLEFEEIFTMIADNAGYLWLSGNYGLQRIPLDHLISFKTAEDNSFQPAVRVFNSLNGMPNSEANGGIFPAGWKMRDGSLWFPTVEGVAIASPSAIDKFQDTVDVDIQSIRVGNKEYSAVKDVTVPPGVHSLQIDYTSIEYNNPDAINFTYRLKGLSNKWEHVGKRRTAYFSELDPGSYTFELQAEQFGQESRVASFSFEVIPFFYQTWWFQLSILAFLFGMGYLVKEVINKSQEEKKLKTRVEEKTEKLQSALDEKEILLLEVHHRVKNNLAIISALMNMQAFASDSDKVKEALLDNELRLHSIAAIHELLYQHESLSEVNFSEVVDKILSNISGTHKNGQVIELRTEIEPITLNVNQGIPFALIINELVTNCYKHAFKGKQTGEIFVSVTKENKIINLQIKDNGVGLGEDFILQEADSLGFELIQNLSQQLYAKVNIESNEGVFVNLRFQKESGRGSTSNII